MYPGLRFLLWGILTCFASGCVQHEIFDTADRPQYLSGITCPLADRYPPPLHKVFLVSSQGSQWGLGGSQFTDYVMYGKYMGRADFVNEPVLSTGVSPPTHERLQQIADDIARAIGHNEHSVDVWAYSMGANCMYQISPMVKAQTGSVEKMHVLLIDPMVLDNFVGGHEIVGIVAFCGMPFAKVVRDGTPYILNCPGYINLSGGSVINIDINFKNPLENFVKFINGDRHYPWRGRSKLQKKILHYLDDRFNKVLSKSYS